MTKKAINMMNPKIARYGREILLSKKYNQMKNYMQHGNVSVLEHSLRVTNASLQMEELMRKLHIPFDERALVRGALLHDYFLYDWHTAGRKYGLHGFTHADTALKNASRDYRLSEREKDIIRQHMFPLNITKPPTSKEAFVVGCADKWCSLVETLAHRGKRK